MYMAAPYIYVLLYSRHTKIHQRDRYLAPWLRTFGRDTYRASCGTVTKYVRSDMSQSVVGDSIFQVLHKCHM